jgi:hypothetical protein
MRAPPTMAAHFFRTSKELNDFGQTRRPMAPFFDSITVSRLSDT